MRKITFNYKREAKQNPYIGFTSFQHFRNDELYSDIIVKPENNYTETEHVECYPVPDYVEEKGRAQGYYPDCSIVYIRILWKEFEPKQGEFNFGFIDSIMKKAEENDQKVMFRLMPHSTRESDDVPDWVKLLIDCPPRPKNMREKISPSDPEFLNLFGNAIRIFGEHYDRNPTLGFVDVSLPGSWGEGSSCELFTEDQLKKFVDIYTDTFKHTLLIGQVIEPWIVNYMNEKGNVGWRADGVGEENHNLRYIPEREQQMSEVWKHAHVSFESYWWLGEWKRKGWDIDDIIERTLKWHVSAFNAKSLPIPMEWKEKIEAWIDKMGYHYVIKSAEIPDRVKAGKKMSIKFTVDNIGVAPIYYNVPLVFKLKNAQVEETFITDVDIRNWIGGEYCEDISFSLPENIMEGEYSLQVGIGGEGHPPICFATDAPQDGFFSILGTVTLE